MFVLRFENDTAGILTFQQGFANGGEHCIFQLRVLIVPNLGDFFHTLDAIFNRLEVFELQLRVDDFFVANRVYTSVDVHYVAVVKTAQHVENGVGLADIAEKLVAESFALRGAFHQPRDVDNFDRGGNDFCGLHQRGQRREAFVGHGDYADIRLNGAKREVGTLCLRVTQTIADLEQRYNYFSRQRALYK